MSRQSTQRKASQGVRDSVAAVKTPPRKPNTGQRGASAEVQVLRDEVQSGFAVMADAVKNLTELLAKSAPASVASSSNTRASWNDAQTLTLIRLYGESGLIKNTGKYQSTLAQNAAYKKVTDGVNAEHGTHFDPEQCRNKINALVKRWKRLQAEAEKTGAEPDSEMDAEWVSALEDAMGKVGDLVDPRPLKQSGRVSEFGQSSAVIRPVRSHISIDANENENDSDTENQPRQSSASAVEQPSSQKTPKRKVDMVKIEEPKTRKKIVTPLQSILIENREREIKREQRKEEDRRFQRMMIHSIMTQGHTNLNFHPGLNPGSMALYSAVGGFPAGASPPRPSGPSSSSALLDEVNDI